MAQSQAKVDTSNLKEDITKLKSQIVESPEELKSQMEKMRETVKKIKNSIVSRRLLGLQVHVVEFLTHRFEFYFFFQTETDDCVVEMQNRVQNVAHTEAEIQQMFGLLQDLESSMNTSKLRQEQVYLFYTST